MIGSIWLKWGSIMGFDFSEEFVNKNKGLVKDFNNLFNELYEEKYIGITGKQTEPGNSDLKEKIVKILKKMYDLGVIISNDFDMKNYSNFEDIEDYIMSYGE